MAYFDFYAGEIPDQQIEELDSIMAVYEKAGVRPFDAALQAVRDMLVRAQNNKVEIERLVLEAAKGAGKKFMGGKLVLQHGRAMDTGGMELHYLRHITYNSVGDIESETYSDDYGFGIAAKTLPELKKKMAKHGRIEEAAAEPKTIKGWLSVIQKAPHNKKDHRFYDFLDSGGDEKKLLQGMVLSLPAGGYKLHSHKYGTNITDVIHKIYGTMASNLMAEPLLLGLSITNPLKVQASFTHDMDKITIFESALSDSIDAAAHQAATSPKNDLPEPTPAQQAAGNYALGSIRLYGLDIAIENPKGSARRGIDPNGKPWKTILPAHYGYIKRTEGADGDHVDVYIGEHPESERVFVVDQQDLFRGGFDEHKIVLACKDQEDARNVYCGGFSDGKGADRIGAITEISLDAFKKWLKTGKTQKPMSAVLEIIKT